MEHEVKRSAPAGIGRGRFAIHMDRKDHRAIAHQGAGANEQAFTLVGFDVPLSGSVDRINSLPTTEDELTDDRVPVSSSVVRPFHRAHAAAGRVCHVTRAVVFLARGQKKNGRKKVFHTPKVQ